jgi:NAD dependent epimerase/dehydratase family enzyme
VWRRYATERNEITGRNVLEQVQQILAAARAMLDPLRGTLILKLGDQVHHGERQFHWFGVLQLAERYGWLLCDERVENGANMPDPKRLHRRHFDSQVRWLVLHSGPRCPGPGLLLAGRARCSYCGRVVACERVGTTNYCRPPRGCKYAAYRQRQQT